MIFDKETEIYTYPCPCGDKFTISLEDLHDGEEIATCPSCTLRIRVVYDSEKLPVPQLLWISWKSVESSPHQFILLKQESVMVQRWNVTRETKRLFKVTHHAQRNQTVTSSIANGTYKLHHYTNECTKVFRTSFISAALSNHNSTDNGIHHTENEQSRNRNLVVNICAAGLKLHRS